MTILLKIPKSIKSKESTQLNNFFSFMFSIPTGASITVVAAVFFLLASTVRDGKKFLWT